MPQYQTMLSKNDVTAKPPNIALIGLGPFVKKHYFEIFQKYHFFPQLIVELNSKKNEINDFVSHYNLEIPFFFISDENRDAENLPEHLERKLLAIFFEKKITHAILATDPKAHLSYLKFFIRNGIHVLVEKPLTAPINCSFSQTSATKVESDYFELLDLIKKHNGSRVDIQCQRRYHPIYQFIQKQLELFVAEFDIPLTYCDIYHCDGMWNMPDEYLFRENHPYKYGYGKLMHSGYHFIDLLACLIKTCFKVCSKEPDEAEVYATSFLPRDSLAVLNQDDYQRFFKNKKYNAIYQNLETLSFNQFGELDFSSILQFSSKKRKLTTCSLNLLQTGFCRRAWDTLPQDTYKSNGRIRHERINLQFGPLFNIQVHSYLSSQTKDSSTKIGGAKHFDIAIFRNSDLIGGKPFEHFTSDFFMNDQEKSFNEISRYQCLMSFLFNKPSLSMLKDHQLSIKILSNSLKSICKKNKSIDALQQFSITKSDLTN